MRTSNEVYGRYYVRAGDLRKRITIRLRVDQPTDDMGMEAVYSDSLCVSAKMTQPGAATYHGGAQTGSRITHYFIIRYRRGISSDHEVFYDKRIFRIRRIKEIMQYEQRFMQLECEELGSEGGVFDGSDSIFTR